MHNSIGYYTYFFIAYPRVYFSTDDILTKMTPTCAFESFNSSCLLCIVVVKVKNKLIKILSGNLRLAPAALKLKENNNK